MHETLLGRRERENTEANSLEEMFERLEMSKEQVTNYNQPIIHSEYLLEKPFLNELLLGGFKRRKIIK
jgi:hypothetical protein